jgi:hypothetical protein
MIKDIYHTLMAIQSPKQFLPTADDVLNADLARRGRVLLIVLKSYEGQGSAIYQGSGGINREYFFAMMERRKIPIGPVALHYNRGFFPGRPLYCT